MVQINFDKNRLVFLIHDVVINSSGYIKAYIGHYGNLEEINITEEINNILKIERNLQDVEYGFEIVIKHFMM